MEEAGLQLIAQGADAFFRDMDKAGDAVDKFGGATDKGAGQVDKFGGATEAAGSKFALFGSVVGAAALAAGAAIVGIGAAALDVASQANQATNDIQASLGVTRDEAERLKGVALEIFGDNFGDSVEDAAASLIVVRQQIKGLADEDLKAVAEGALAIRDVFGVEVAESTNVANTLMQQFGLSGQQALDLIAGGFQRGLNSSDDFLDTLGEYGNLFASNGFTADQFFSILETGIQGGVLGTDKIADAMKEFGIRIRELPDTVFGPDGSLTGALGFTREQADVLFNGLQDGSVSVADAYAQIMPALAGLDNEVWQNTIGVQLFGTQWEDLGAAAVLGVDQARTSLDDLAGSTDGLNAKYNSLGAVGETLWRQTLVTLEPVGAALLDLANLAMPAILEGFAAFRGVLEAVVGPTADFINALGGDSEALDRLPGVLQGIVGAAQGIPGVLDSGRQSLDAFFNTPLGTEIQQGAQVVADYFSGDFQADLSNGVAVVQGALETWAASPWGQDVIAGAGVVQTKFAEVGSYIVNDWAGDFQAGVQIASDAASEFGAAVGPYLEPAQVGAQVVADYMLNDFPTDFRAGTDLVIGFVTNLPKALQDGWSGMVAGAKQAGDDMIAGIEALGGRALAAGRGFVNNIKDGILGAFDSLIAEARRKFEELTDLLPGSEPKDTSSPLYDLGRRGDALVGNLAQGVLESDALRDAVAAVAAGGEEELQSFIDRVGKLAQDALGGAIGLLGGRGDALAMERRASQAATDAQAAARRAADQQADARLKAAARVGALEAKLRDDAARDAQRIADLETAATRTRADIAAARYTAANNIDPAKRLQAEQQALQLERQAADQQAAIAAARAEQQATLERNQTAILDAQTAAQREQLRLEEQRRQAQQEAQRAQQEALALQRALNAALAEANELGKTDPQAAEDYLDLRRRQIAAIADLQAALARETDAGRQDLIRQQLALTQQRQALEAAQLAGAIQARASEAGQVGAAVAQQIATITQAGGATYNANGGNTININGATISVQQLAGLIGQILAGQASRADIYARTS